MNSSSSLSPSSLLHAPNHLILSLTLSPGHHKNKGETKSRSLNLPSFPVRSYLRSPQSEFPFVHHRRFPSSKPAVCSFCVKSKNQPKDDDILCAECCACLCVCACVGVYFGWFVSFLLFVLVGLPHSSPLPSRQIGHFWGQRALGVLYTVEAVVTMLNGINTASDVFHRLAHLSSEGFQCSSGSFDWRVGNDDLINRLCLVHSTTDSSANIWPLRHLLSRENIVQGETDASGKTTIFWIRDSPFWKPDDH